MLKDKVILIMGGTSGLGLSAARACAAAGARLVITGREDDHVEVIRREITSAIVLTGDAARAELADRAVTEAVRQFGRLDGLYHVAGGSGRRKGDGPLHELSDEGWDYTIGLNLTSVMYSNRAALRQFMTQKTGGSVLNMASVLAFSPSPRHFASHAYTAAKAGIIGMTRTCASAYAQQGIRFNAICPAMTITPMSQRATADQRIMRYVATKQPLDGGRAGMPGDLDGAVLYLLSDASKFVTGQVLSVDGGWSVTEGQHE